jgi:small-conductance mechanosensitive channel
MMTEAELWQMMLLASETTFSGLARVSTVFFAYLAAAYFVGAKLTRSQAALATVLFHSQRGMLVVFHIYLLQTRHLLHARAFGELRHRKLRAKSLNAVGFPDHPGIADPGLCLFHVPDAKEFEAWRRP